MKIGEILTKITPDGEPPLISQLSRVIWAPAVAQAAIRLELFNKLHGQKLNSAAVSNLLGSHHRFTELLLNACVALGLLEIIGDEYQNTKESDTYLVKGQPRYYGDLFTYWVDQWPLLNRLDSGVLTGTPIAHEIPAKSKVEEAKYWRHYMMAMHQWGASHQQDFLLQNTNLKGKKKLLDVGGGSGVYSIAFVKKYVDLTVVLFDQEKALPFTKSFIEAEGLSQRISTVAGDFHTDPFGTGYDAVLISGVLMLESLDVCRHLFRKSYESLESGGLIIVQDSMRMGPYTKTTPFPALNSLTVAVLYGGEGEAHSGDEMEDGLTSVGFISPKQILLPGKSSLVTAQKP